ncbi:MAG: SDR family NAD(P)-dependent oxidoreductase [Alphaproteobacteria bacterium]
MTITLITGAASGIGAAVARRLAGPDRQLMLHSRSNRDGLEKVAAVVTDSGSAAEIILGDLTDDAFADSLICETVERLGGLDQIVSNAGFADRRLLGDVDVESLIKAEKGMPEAFFRMATNAMPHLTKSDCGRVVAVSSFVAHVFALDGLFPTTAAAKAAIEALAKSLAVQLAPDGVTVNCVAPGYTKKDATGHSALPGDAWTKAAAKSPMGRIGTPEDVAGLIAFLLSEEAAFITGQTIHVDGGLTLA